MIDKTVAAISTPPGEGGIAVIRISGPEAIVIADKSFRSYTGRFLSEIKGYSALYGEVVSENSVIDDAVATVFRAPKSFTGENTVEFSVHGGRLVAKNVLRAVIKNGACPADRGEFTKRAFLNGKIDLTKAESIINIINAKNEIALKISQAAKNGRISKEIDSLIEKLLELSASFSVYADYPDDEIENLNPENFHSSLDEILCKLKNMIDTFDLGKKLCDGIECAIIGKPNVGKSTLMNALSRTERSIVTDIAGTTRDVVDSAVVLGDTTLILSDTAGIHQTDDIVEKAGVDRSFQKLDSAMIVIAVFDASSPLDDDDRIIIDSISDNAIIVLNKSDLGLKADISAFKGMTVVNISAKNNQGIDTLSEAILAKIKADRLDSDDAVLINDRQFNCVNRAYESLYEAKTAMENHVTLDAVGICIDDSLKALLELTGRRVTNEVSDEIFSRFCVGK
ncbi:MAG TPA: tRNA uridine-5-carboxymethylaminomethyl(34) synthesis GTPase MnmE [Ruminococcaceae bacterium]|nr:tRNA uridine-5-carboxymethylaminomethyl(34) synthesis GTPase MnmE [Oscillospiraceae bacterium]